MQVRDVIHFIFLSVLALNDAAHVFTSASISSSNTVNQDSFCHSVVLSLIHWHKLISLSAPGCCMWAITLVVCGGILTCPSITARDPQWHPGLFACLTVIRRAVLRVKPAVCKRCSAVSRTTKVWQGTDDSERLKALLRVCKFLLWHFGWALQRTYSGAWIKNCWKRHGQLFWIKLVISWSWTDLSLCSRTLFLSSFYHKVLQLAGGRFTHCTALPAWMPSTEKDLRNIWMICGCAVTCDPWECVQRSDWCRVRPTRWLCLHV